MIPTKSKCCTSHAMLCTASRRKLPTTCSHQQDPSKARVPEKVHSHLGVYPQVTTNPAAPLRLV